MECMRHAFEDHPSKPVAVRRVETVAWVKGDDGFQHCSELENVGTTGLWKLQMTEGIACSCVERRWRYGYGIIGLDTASNQPEGSGRHGSAFYSHVANVVPAGMGDDEDGQ